MAGQCEKICRDFERETEPGIIKEWEAVKRSWERDSSNPDPYKLAEKRESY